MNFSRMVLMICLLLLLAASVSASDWTDRYGENGIQGNGRDTLRTECYYDFLVTSLPYFNTANLIGAGNDCLIRTSEDHIYEVHIATAGSYTFSTCGSTNNLDTYIYLRTGCCSGTALTSNNNGCTGQPGPSLIQCFPLNPGVYYLIVETQLPGDEGPYSLSITPCDNPCELAFRQDGIHQNENGTFTYVQTTDENDEAPLYNGPWQSTNPCAPSDPMYGFGYYSWYDQDYGWKHVWPGYNDENGVCVQSVRVYICAYDVDESDCNILNPGHPERCELDHVYGDGALLNPEYLSGSNGQWSVTMFDLPPSAILDNGDVNMFIDIDVWNDHCTWATELNWSQLVVTYRATQCNQPPFTPTGTYTGCVTDDSAMCVEVTGPVPADPDGDNVTYTYRWFVSNEATGFGFVDDENHPTHPVNHTGPCVPASDSDLGDTWRVVVYAVDSHGTQSIEPWTITFFPIIPACGPGPLQGWDYGDHDPECYPTGTHETGGPANPIHENNVAWLGATVTAELAVVPGADDGPTGGDDGVDFLSRPWMPCDRECVDVTVTTGPGYNGEPLFIWGWKDGNLDCDWDDAFCLQGDFYTAPECIISGVPVTDMTASDSRTVNLCFMDPGVLDLGRYDGRLRFRLVSEELNCVSAITSVDPLLGETEDYVITDLQLDVQLASFTAVQNGAAVDVRWTTASEMNTDHFIVERQNGSAWTNVSGNIAAAGNSTDERHYLYNDRNVEAGTTYTYRLAAVDMNSVREVLEQVEVTVLTDHPTVIEEYALYQNYPNPFNPTTSITFDLKEAGHVSLRVFNVLGREVAQLVNGNRNAGRYQVTFDANELPSGLYLYRLETPGFTSMQKMVLMK